MSAEELDETDFEDMDMDENEADAVGTNNDNSVPDARRRLEARLEDERLKRQLSEYDFDLDD
ncbi:PA3496 family putative envelope integrity protein [Porticoccus sp. GXU_MW_L64]